jgi:tetratricopeptide (TPR) repeat protein/tRNA A-37 threonylcarbamoyl transferase component Bud32
MSLTENIPNAREQLLDEVLANFLKAAQQGQAPSRQTLVERYPQLAGELAEFFADQDHVERLAAPLRAIAPHPPPLAAGTVLGDYELLEEIAHGGMGIVYRARQKSLQRLVAVKVLQAGPLATSEQWQRFQAEAESVASLDHPNIVPVYEVDVYDNRPYFSMKLLEGGSLADRLCSGDRPAPREAAQLLSTVADAVYYAHQHGILHRDLKPANILLDGQGQPHVSDFGLAKRAGGAAGETGVTQVQGSDTPVLPAALTVSGAIVGTPSYMAPEQAAGSRTVTTATDVYGLGTILYELLTGRPPFRGEHLFETLRRIQEEEPAAPRSLDPHIERDLETICLKCLQKDPARRYGSAGELALDLRRYLAGEPIAARPVGRLERLWLWCRRRPVAAAVTLAFLAVIVTAFVLIDRARRQAEDREHRLAASQDEARRVLDEFCQELSKENWGEDPLVSQHRKTLLEKSLAYYQKFLNDPQAEAPARDELVAAYVRIGDIEVALALPDKALEAFGRARAAAETLRQLHPDDVKARLWLGRIHDRIGLRLRDANRSDEALEAYRTAYDLLHALRREAPEDGNVEGELSVATNNLGSLYLRLGRRDEALASYRECVEINRDLCRRSQDLQYPYALAISLGNLSAVLYDLGQRPEAWKHSEEANQLLREVIRKDPKAPRYHQALGQNLHNRGIRLCKEKRPSEAIGPLTEGREVLTRLVEIQPRAWWYQIDLALLLRQLGNAYRDFGDSLGNTPAAHEPYDKAGEAYQAAAQVNKELTTRQSNPAEARFRLAGCFFDVGLTQSKRGRKEEAIRAYRQVGEECRRLIQKNPDHLDYHSLLGLSLNNLGRELWRLKRYPESLQSLREALEHTRLLYARAPRREYYRIQLNTTLVFLGAVYRDTGRRKEWADVLRERRAMWPDNNGELLGIACDLAWAKADDEAMQTLELMVSKGFKDFAQLEKEPALTSVRQRPDYLKLVQQKQ